MQVTGASECYWSVSLLLGALWFHVEVAAVAETGTVELRSALSGVLSGSLQRRGRTHSRSLYPNQQGPLEVLVFADALPCLCPARRCAVWAGPLLVLKPRLDLASPARLCVLGAKVAEVAVGGRRVVSVVQRE